MTTLDDTLIKDNLGHTRSISVQYDPNTGSGVILKESTNNRVIAYDVKNFTVVEESKDKQNIQEDFISSIEIDYDEFRDGLIASGLQEDEIIIKSVKNGIIEVKNTKWIEDSERIRIKVDFKFDPISKSDTSVTCSLDGKILLIPVEERYSCIDTKPNLILSSLGNVIRGVACDFDTLNRIGITALAVSNGIIFFKTKNGELLGETSLYDNMNAEIVNAIAIKYNSDKCDGIVVSGSADNKAIVCPIKNGEIYIESQIVIDDFESNITSIDISYCEDKIEYIVIFGTNTDNVRIYKVKNGVAPKETSLD